MKNSVLLLSLLLFYPLIGSANTNGPTRQTVTESITINSPPDKVWEVVGNFAQLNAWHPAVKSIEMQDDKTRVLTLNDGNTITEQLKFQKDEDMIQRYKITDMTVLEKVTFSDKEVARRTLPIDTYTATLKVVPEGTGSKVTWTGKFYPAWLYAPPAPEGMSDKDAIAAVEGVYKAGLEQLKKQLDGGEATAKIETPAATETAENTATASTIEAASSDQKTTTAAADDKPYSNHIQCDSEGKNCKIDKYLTKGFRTFSQCQVCHGIDGTGSTIAPSLLTKLNENIDYDLFVKRVTDGYQGGIGVMPPWKDNPNVMNNIDSLYTYLKARADGVIPAGKVERY